MTSSVTPLPRDLLSRWITAIAAALLAAAVVLVPALPAAAHDELVSTDPAADAVMESLPAVITFTFSADVLTDQGATVVEVTDASGTVLNDGVPEEAGDTVTQALSGTASGPIGVKWRVVSSDGHPIDGSFSFTVTPASPTPSATSTTSSSAAASPTASQNAEPTPNASATAVVDASSPSPLPWILLVVALVVVAGVLVFVFASRGGRKTAGGGTAGR